MQANNSKKNSIIKKLNNLKKDAKIQIFELEKKVEYWKILYENSSEVGEFK